MIVLFTDFGLTGPYVGQMKVAIAAEAPAVPVIDLFHDAPAFDVCAAAYLLPAYTRELPQGAVVVAVVDPGVGTARDPIVVETGGRRFVGPDNGLFAPLAAQCGAVRVSRIDWRPPRLSASFHGRDLFAPAAARLCAGHSLETTALDGLSEGRGWPADRAMVVYVDRFGNAVTGLRAAHFDDRAVLHAGGRELARARTFAEVPAGTAFWYENANGLVEIAVNQGRADEALGLAVGAPVYFAAAGG